MEHLISVIVPIYNSACYIRGCVESVLSQTYPYFELILVDDGSDDHSKEICKVLCEEDERIRLIEKKHKGVSVARNAGMKEAKGKYLFFLDSDDIIHPQLLEELYRLQEKKGTVIAAVKHCFVEETAFCRLISWKMEDDYAVNCTYLKNKEALNFRMCGIGGKMILRKAAENVWFNEKLSNGEDTLFLYQLLLKGADASVLDRRWYYCRKHEGSASSVCSISLCRDIYQVFCYIRNQEVKNNRLSNAARWEKDILEKLMEWYGISRRKYDRNLREYIGKLAKIEKRSSLFSISSAKQRIIFTFMFYCYPLFLGFKCLSYILKIWKGIRKIFIKISRMIKRKIVWVKWRIKGKITWLKWFAKEEWAKAWKIRNKARWAGIWLRRICLWPWS